MQGGARVQHHCSRRSHRHRAFLNVVLMCAGHLGALSGADIGMYEEVSRARSKTSLRSQFRKEAAKRKAANDLRKKEAEQLRKDEDGNMIIDE